MWQQNQALPFSPDQIMTQYLNISLNNPPYVPQYQGIPQVQHVAPLVAAMAAMEIQQNSTKNPLRIFMYNQYARDNFVNADFDGAVCAILDYISYELITGLAGDPGISSQNAVPMIIGMLCAANIKLFPMLRGYLDPQSLRGLDNDVMAFENLAQRINVVKSQMGNVNQMNPTGNFNPMMPQQMRGGYQPQQMAVVGGFGGGRSMVSPTVGGTSLFSGNPHNTANIGKPTGTMGGAKYGNDAVIKPTVSNVLQQPFTARAPNTIEPVQELNANLNSVNVEVLAKDSPIEWYPTEDRKYLPAYNPVDQEMFYVINNDQIIDIRIKEKDTPVMDYDRHSIQTVFGPIPKDTDFSKANEVFNNINKGIEKINAAAEIYNTAGVDNDAPEVSTYIDNKFLANTSLTSAWLAGALDRLQTPGEIPDVYRTYSQIVSPIIGDVDETYVVENFRESRTFIELREKLDSSVNDISVGVWNCANTRMTNVVNRILKQNLSLPHLSIDSFVADIQTLIEHLGNKFGSVIQDAFFKNQRKHIAAVFQVVTEETARDLTEGLFCDRQFDENATPKITYISSEYSLTYLNCTSHELEIELNNNTSSVITETYTPVMYKLLEGLFSDVVKHSENGMFDRHLIRTTDSRIMEATKGYLGDDVYLLTLVH